MSDFALGFVCGIVILAVIWWRMDPRRGQVTRFEFPDGTKAVQSQEKVDTYPPRPDHETAFKMAESHRKAEKEFLTSKKTSGGS